MNASELLTNLSQQGIKLSADKDKLRIHSPKGVLTPQLRENLACHKQEILALLRETPDKTEENCISDGQGLSLSTIGRLIAGFNSESPDKFIPPAIAPQAMARQLTVTFRPLPKGYNNPEVLLLRAKLEEKLREYGVTIQPWERATTEYQFQLPPLNIPVKTRLVRAAVNAVIDVERPPSLLRKLGMCVSETFYQAYCRWIAKGRKLSVSTIAKLSSWAEDRAAQRVEDPTNTQVIILKQLDEKLADFQLPYREKIQIGLNTLIENFAEIAIGVSPEKFSILNMNLSDSIFAKKDFDRFVLKSLIPKIFVPILPLPLSKFELGEYDPSQSLYAPKLVTLGHQLGETGLLPPGSKLSKIIKRKSHRDMVDILIHGRTGLSYGFVAYVEAPQYIGEREISESEWENLSPVAGFNRQEIRQNQNGRRYLKTKIGSEFTFKQIPDIWLVSSRSGSNKTDLNLHTDILRVGLTNKLQLQVPQGTDPAVGDIKPSYDIYVMVAIALSAALYAPDLVKNGAPIVHFHGYPAKDWFKDRECWAGADNPSVPCGTYESGVFNFLSIYHLASQDGDRIALAGLVEPDHGTNIIAPDTNYLIERLKAGCENGQIELGGKHFASLKQ